MERIFQFNKHNKGDILIGCNLVRTFMKPHKIGRGNYNGLYEFYINFYFFTHTLSVGIMKIIKKEN